MDDVLDLLAVYNQFECEPAAMALEIIRLRRELLATTSRLLSYEITESLSDQAPTSPEIFHRVSVSEEPGHQVTQLPSVLDLWLEANRRADT